jgi:uncharacterized protein (TIGR02099 family)
MNDLTAGPTRLLRASAALAKWALRLLALAWLALGIFWGLLHFLIVPRIDNFRPWLEQQATKAVGATVRIGSIAAASNGLIPSIEFHNIALLDSQGREALRIPVLAASLSPRSALGLGFEQLYVDGLQLDVRRQLDGQIRVAGFSMDPKDGQNVLDADWVFSQSELAIRHATIHWTDEVRRTPTVVLDDVDWVLRNRRGRHAMRFAANPPAGWGSRFSISALMSQPLLTRHPGQWKQWEGQLFADFAAIDLAQLHNLADVGAQLSQGSGALRAWADVAQGALTRATLDLALANVRVILGAEQEPLALDTVAGRLGVGAIVGGYEYSTEGLQFATSDGLRWPGGNVRVAWVPATPQIPAHGEFSGDHLDLAALSRIALRLPLGPAVHDAVNQRMPEGLIEQIQSSWQLPPDQPLQFSAKGRVAGLHLAAVTGKAEPSIGVHGANVDFNLTQGGGKLGVQIREGTIDAPGIFEEPTIPIDELGADVQLTLDGAGVTVNVPNLRFANADANGLASLRWTSADRPLGQLDLQGTMARASLSRVSRYLPLKVDKEVRDYLRDALVQGRASNVKFKFAGKPDDFPYQDAKTGDFRVSASVEDGMLAFVPARLTAALSKPWPVLTRLSAEVVLDHALLQVTSARGSIAGSSSIQLSKGEASLSHLYHDAQLAIAAQASGPLADSLALLNATPLASMTGNVLSDASATGNADIKFRFGFPLAAMDRATLQGALVLGGNDLQLSPDSPRFSRSRGTIAFNESGFTVAGGQARALGGEVRIEGGMDFSAPGALAARQKPQVLRFQGNVSSDGLRQARELGFIAHLAQFINGSTAYSGTLGMRAGALELQLSSALTGMSLNLPAPLSKPPETALAMRLETNAVRTATSGIQAQSKQRQDQIRLELGNLASVVYMRDLTQAEPRVVRGSIGVGLTGDESAPLPSEGVVANVNVGEVDIDAWSAVISSLSGSGLEAVSPAQMSYLPTSLAVRATQLTYGGRKLRHLVAGGVREGKVWRANLDADEVSGYVEYRQPTGPAAGRLYARLARLVVGPSTAQDVETLLDEQPVSIPALDIVADDFELRGKKLGKLDIEAINLGAGSGRDAAREWRLNHFNVSNPDATFTANGNWANSVGANRSLRERRRTALNFKLDVADGGELLSRFGMGGVVRKGRGKIEGQVGWAGSPITPDYPSMGGSFNVNVETGQFLKADPGIAKLLGVLSLQSLPRRLALDFRDVFSEGFAFDFLRGDVVIDQGIARTSNLQMKGVNAAVLMEGQADIAKETQTINVLVVPEINAGSASLIASAINPLVGLSTFLAQVILRRPLIDAATQEFVIDGTWIDPRVTKVERKAPAAKSGESK